MKLINLRQIEGGQNLIAQVNKLINDSGNIESRITAIQNTVFPVYDKIDLSKLTASEVNFTLTNEPNAQKVELNINGIIYEEDDAFTVARPAKTLTWTFDNANGGFDIDKDLADHITAKYYTGVLLENDSTVKMLRMDSLPTTGAYTTGDMIIKLTPTTGSNIGWICTKSGTPGTWIPIGITDFANVLKVEDSSSAG